MQNEKPVSTRQSDDSKVKVSPNAQGTAVPESTGHAGRQKISNRHAAFLASQKEKTPQATQEAAEPPLFEVEVVGGDSGRKVGKLATIPQSVDISAFRKDFELTVFEDPMALVGQAMQVADAVIAEMHSDLEHQMAHVRQTQQAAAVMRDRLQQVRLEKLEHRTASRAASLMSEQAANDLGGVMAQFQQEMGEPQSPNSSGQNGSSGCS